MTELQDLLVAAAGASDHWQAALARRLDIPEAKVRAWPTIPERHWPDIARLAGVDFLAVRGAVERARAR